MKNKIEELYELLKLDRRNSAWSKTRTLQERYQELKSEVEELGEAIENNDFDNLEEELGDCLWDILSCVIVAEEKHLIKPKVIVQRSINKLKGRKPWILKENNYTMQEETKMWKENKLKEKKLQKHL
jgi:NTP pyrophosphatase (non-canonical NTP hydrolase)